MTFMYVKAANLDAARLELVQEHGDLVGVDLAVKLELLHGLDVDQTDGGRGGGGQAKELHHPAHLRVRKVETSIIAQQILCRYVFKMNADVLGVLVGVKEHKEELATELGGSRLELVLASLRCIIALQSSL